MAFRSRTRRASCHGHTMVEAMMVLVLSAFLVAIVSNLVTSSGDSQAFSQRMARAIEVNQKIMNEVRGDLLSAVGLLQNDAVGKGFFATLDFETAAQPIDSSALPTAVVAGNFGKETTAGARTGNALMSVSQAWTTEFLCGSGRSYLIDVYRITCLYLSKSDRGGPSQGTPGGLDLSKFVSEPIADGARIDEITDPADQTEVLLHLLGRSADVNGDLHPPLTLIWRRGEDPAAAGALREIDPATATISSTPVPPRSGWKIRRDDGRSERGLLEFRNFSIASNFASRRFGVARFGKRHSIGDGFPHGFEIQMRGPKSSREVLIHSSIVGTNNKGTKAHSDLRATVMIQDM